MLISFLLLMQFLCVGIQGDESGDLKRHRSKDGSVKKVCVCTPLSCDSHMFTTCMTEQGTQGAEDQGSGDSRRRTRPDRLVLNQFQLAHGSCFQEKPAVEVCVSLSHTHYKVSRYNFSF